MPKRSAEKKASEADAKRRYDEELHKIKKEHFNNELLKQRRQEANEDLAGSGAVLVSFYKRDGTHVEFRAASAERRAKRGDKKKK